MQKIVLEDFKDDLAVEQNIDGTHYSTTILLYDNIDESLDVIAAADNYWSAFSGHCLACVERKIHNIVMIFMFLS